MHKARQGYVSSWLALPCETTLSREMRVHTCLTVMWPSSSTKYKHRIQLHFDHTVKKPLQHNTHTYYIHNIESLTQHKQSLNLASTHDLWDRRVEVSGFLLATWVYFKVKSWLKQQLIPMVTTHIYRSALYSVLASRSSFQFYYELLVRSLRLYNLQKLPLKMKSGNSIVKINLSFCFSVVCLKFSEESKGIHQLLWKKHSVRSYCNKKPPDRTLFVVNVPPYCTKVSFFLLFFYEIPGTYIAYRICYFNFNFRFPSRPTIFK